MDIEPGTEVTVSDRELLEIINEKLDTLHGKTDSLLRAWQEYEPVVSAFRRGGLLAARTAAKNGARRV